MKKFIIKIGYNSLVSLAISGALMFVYLIFVTLKVKDNVISFTFTSIYCIKTIFQLGLLYFQAFKVPEWSNFGVKKENLLVRIISILTWFDLYVWLFRLMKKPREENNL